MVHSHSRPLREHRKLSNNFRYSTLPRRFAKDTFHQPEYDDNINPASSVETRDQALQAVIKKLCILLLCNVPDYAKIFYFE